MAALPAVVALLFLGAANLPASFSDTLLVEASVFGSFERATRLVVSPQGWIYVIDSNRSAVFLFKDLASPTSFVGGYGWTPTAFDQPSGLASDGLSLYVADFGNHRIQRFDRFLNYISVFSTRDTNAVSARFGYPAGVALSRFGDLFIIDTENLRVAKYTGSGKYERSFGGIDDPRGKLQKPLKILAAQDDHVFVLEAERLLEFDYFGNYIRTIGAEVLKDARGFDVVEGRAVVAARDTIYWFSERGRLALVTSARSILTTPSISGIEDIAIVRDRLFVLTRHNVFVLNIRSIE